MTKSRAPTRRDLFAGPACFLGLGFGSGMAPFAPGTFGTIAAVPLYILVASVSQPLFWISTLAILLSGTWVCGTTARQLDSHDHPAIVWDEFAGFFITMLLVPLTVTNVVIGFLLFRVFDIVKPWPIKWVDQKIHGGLGIMLDDVIAGAIAGVLLWLSQPWLVTWI